MLTHGNIIWNNINAILADDATSQEITLVVAPLFHIGGLNVTPLLSFLKGATVVLEQMFEPGMVLENIEKFHITSMFGVPAMYLFMAQHPEFATRDLSSIPRALVRRGAGPGGADQDLRRPRPPVQPGLWAHRDLAVRVLPPLVDGYAEARLCRHRAILHRRQGRRRRRS